MGTVASRTRCSAPRRCAAEPGPTRSQDGPRISSAPLRAAQHAGHGRSPLARQRQARRACAGNDEGKVSGAIPKQRFQFSNSRCCKHSFAISPRVSLEFCVHVPPSEIRGRREYRAPEAPAASHAKVESTRVSHHGHTGSPGIPRAMVLTGSFALSPVTGLSCHRRPQEACFSRT